MPHYNELCIRLFSDLFPCPWLKHIPQLKYTRERLEGHRDDLKPPLPEYLRETMELCQGCRHYEPIDVFRRLVDALDRWHGAYVNVRGKPNSLHSFVSRTLNYVDRIKVPRPVSQFVHDTLLFNYDRHHFIIVGHFIATTFHYPMSFDCDILSNQPRVITRTVSRSRSRD